MADRTVFNADSGLPELWADLGAGLFALAVSTDTGAVGVSDHLVFDPIRGVVERWKESSGTFARCLTTTAGAGVVRFNPEVGLNEKYVSQQSGAYHSRLVTTTDGAGVTVFDNANGVARKYVAQGGGAYAELVAVTNAAGVASWNAAAGLAEKFVGSGPYARLLTAGAAPFSSKPSTA